MASIQVLKETENGLTIKIVGATGPEDNAVVVDASTLRGATGVVNTLNVDRLSWSANSTGQLNLMWFSGATGATGAVGATGATGVDMVKLSGSSHWNMKGESNLKLTNEALYPNGDITLTATNGNFTIIMDLEKSGPGWTKVGSYGS